MYAVEVYAGNGKLAAAVGSHRDQHRVKTLLMQIGKEFSINS